MEKKSNKGLYAVIGVLTVLVIALIVAVVVLMTSLNGDGKRDEKEPTEIEETIEESKGKGGRKEKEESKDETMEETEEETESSQGGVLDYFAKEVDEEDNDVSGNAIKVVVDGFKMMVPLEYNCLYADEIGIVIYMDDVFHMKVAISQKTFDEIKDNPEVATDKVIAAGGEILQDVKFAEVDGKEYAYFLMHLEGSDCFVGYTQASDQDKCVGSQMVIDKADLTDEDLLNIFASVASTATVTDEPNSTQEDIHEEIKNATFGERKSESSLTFKDETVTFDVPAEFYGMGTDEWDYYAMEMFSTTDYISANCYLWSTTTGDYEGAEAYIANQVDFSGGEDAVMEEEEVKGITFYYFMEDYEYDDSRYQKIYAACDVGETGIYVIEVNAIDVDREINLELIEDFMNVK